MDNKPSRDRIYVELRDAVLAGTIQEVTLIRARDVVDRFACTETAARGVLGALLHDGYLRLGRERAYRGPEWLPTQLDEQINQVIALQDFCVMRLAQGNEVGLRKLCAIRQRIADAPRDSEERFQIALEWVRALLAVGGGEGLGEFAGKVIPAAFFRIVWIADCGEPETFPTAIGATLELAAAGQVEAARDHHPRFWNSVREPVQSFLKDRIDGRARVTRSHDPAAVRDLSLSGASQGFGRSLLDRNMMLPRLGKHRSRLRIPTPPL